MKTQAINAQGACFTRNTQNTVNPNFKGGYTYVAVPVTSREDSFVKWAGKNVVAASAFSVIWDLGTNVVSKFVKDVDAVSGKQMLKNIPTVAGVFLLVGGIFKLVNNIMDK